MVAIKLRGWDKGSHYMDYKIKNIDFENQTILFAEIPFSFDDVDLMQFTGLYDRNSKEIYEGDIVEHRYGKSVVEWNDAYSGFEPFRGDINCPDSETESEVIGNVYENPELFSPAI